MLSNVGTPYWWVNEESEAILNRGYLLKGEDIQGAIKRITSAAASRLDKPELQSIFEELVVKGWLSMSSPIWANMGTQRGLPISCFGVNVPDSIEGITSKLGEVIMQTKIGGGTSGSFSELRGRGAAVTDNGNSSGAVSFMRLFDTAMEVVSQGCYTEDTEIYTEKGWMNIKDYVNLQDSTIRLPEWIHDYNMRSMLHDYQQPKAFLKYNNNTIYRFFSEEHKIDVRVTGNHQMILVNPNSEITDTVTAKTLFNKYDKFQDCYIITLNEDFTYKKADVQVKDLSVQIIKDTPTNVYCVEVNGTLAVRKDKNHTPILCGNSTRRGSFAAYLDIDHPDIKEFLTIKSVNSSIQNLFYGVCVPDWWLIEMIDGDEQKRELWAKILESRQQKGLPYIFFTDNVNNHKPEIYKKLGRTIVHSNLCVAPYTKILTSNGYIPIGDLENEEVEVWNGEEWSEVTITKTGENQNLVRVMTNSGYELDCTPYHKFYVQKGYSHGTGKNKLEIIEKRAEELQPGDKLIKFDLPIIEGVKDLNLAYANGFYSGDGCLTREGQRIYLYGEKRKLKNNFSFIDKWIIQNDFDREYGHTNKLKDKFFVPNVEYTIKSRLEWLAGYLDADGTVTNNEGSQSLQITSINKEFLQEIQLMLQTLGCDSKIILSREKGRFLLPKNDGTGELGYYDCNEIYRLLINGNSLYKLNQLGLKCKRLEWIVKKPNRECSQFIKVVSVENLDYTTDTYCFNEPKKHLGMFNGILTGQCSEIALPNNEDESFVCCLSSMNLALYDEWKDTDAIKYAIYFLDAVMSEFVEKTKGRFGLKQSHNFAKNHRALGLGVMGLHTYYQKNMIPFDDPLNVARNTKIFSEIQLKALEASKELAEIYGPAPIFNEVKDENLIKYRNTTVLAIAP